VENIMAFNTGNGQGFMSEINVTPFVDVMLVLLIIFMVTAPMMTQGLDVDLPKVDAGTMRIEDEHLVITMNQAGEIYLDEFQVPLEDMGIKIKRLLEVKKTSLVLLKADQNIPYGAVAKVISEIRRAGVTNLGLPTEPEVVEAPDKKTDS
jgi:biopolymer transport protein TolR